MGNRILKIGNTGDDVRDAQSRLAHLKFLEDKLVTGVFGVETVRAVIAFQAANFLNQDGVVGPASWSALIDQSGDASIPDWGTAGPAREDHPAVISTAGQYSGAVFVQAHANRTGPAIQPCAIVVHTTDTLEGSTGAIVRSWSTTPGNGACAHFIVDRAGVVTQMVSVYRNGNHAGGPIHGNWKTPAGKLVHPNVWAIGIELEAGGRLGKRTPAGFVHPDTKRVIPDANVVTDGHGIGWHVVTEAQLVALDTLMDALLGVFVTSMPVGTIVEPDGTYKANGVDYYASSPTNNIVGHVTLDPVNKTDPGPQVMQHLRKRF